MIRTTYIFILALLIFAMPVPESMAAQTDNAVTKSSAQQNVQGQGQGQGQGQMKQGRGQGQLKQEKGAPGNRAGKRGGYGKRGGPRDGSGPGNGPKDGTGPYHDADNPRWK